MKRSEFRFLDRLRVRWAEVDMQKIVFNGHYLMYFDTAVAGYWRAMALPYHDTMESLQGDLFVRKATLEYLGSARYDDLCETGVRCARIGNSSMLLACAVFRGEELLVHGELVYVFADPASQTSKPVPAALREVLEGFEAGQPMLDVRVGSWSELGPAAKPLRQSVFVDEHHLPALLAEADDDTDARHALALNRFGLPVATGRLLSEEPGVARIGRMAVLPTLRGSGVGRAVLDALLAAARQRGDRQALLHAQTGAVPFYLRAGFVPRGPVFEQSGVGHQEMVLAL